MAYEAQARDASKCGGHGKSHPPYRATCTAGYGRQKRSGQMADALNIHKQPTKPGLAAVLTQVHRVAIIGHMAPLKVQCR